MNAKKLSKQIWLVMTGFSCNNNCIMCSTSPKANFYPDRKTQEIIDDLVKGKKDGYDKVEFTGGEPTIRPDIPYLIKLAKDLGYREIALSTNGRMLSYREFCQKIIENGVNKITFTLNAHNSKLGDAIYRTPGVFNQTIRGVKNILKYSQINISVNTVIFQLNYRYLQQIGKYIYDLGIKNWHLTDLIPDGNAKKFYKALVVEMSDLSNNINNLGDIIKKFNLVVFFDFPLCLFSPQMLNNPRISFITAKGRTEITKQIGYKPDRFKIFTDDVYVDKHKQRIKICQNCKFFKVCGGIWKDYLKLYGERGLRNIARKHGCLIND